VTPGSPVPSRPGEPAIPGAAPEHLEGGGFHVCRDVAGLRLRGLRHRRRRPAHRRLAGATHASLVPPRRASFSGLQVTPFGRYALEQALHDRRPGRGGGLVHHRHRGVQYGSIKDAERRTAAGVEPSVGRVGDSDDNALAETINGLDKAEVIRRRGPWRSLEAVEFATLEGVDGSNNRRLLEPIGGIPPAEAEARHYAEIEDVSMAASLNANSLRQTRSGSGFCPRRLNRVRPMR
jgi:hypothetical protein